MHRQLQTQTLKLTDMKHFFDKYAHKLDECIALKVLDLELEKAIEDEASEGNYLYHLAALHEMITDYFQVKGTRPDLHKTDS